MLQGKVPFVSTDGIDQLHIFIFLLAISHVLYCVITLALGRAKMRKWKTWEMETRTVDYQFSHDPERFRFTRDTTFGRRHLSFWSRAPVLLWVAHLAPQSETKFDFQKYIKRSLEEDFKVVVGINPIIWFFAVLFLLFNTHDHPAGGYKASSCDN
ncbi:Mlo-related protein - like 7 [Theobroma cacao]|nr:Mlo-related protein - like 7 [Theobroma cacao]